MVVVLSSGYCLVCVIVVWLWFGLVGVGLCYGCVLGVSLWRVGCDCYVLCVVSW